MSTVEVQKEDYMVVPGTISKIVMYLYCLKNYLQVYMAH
jgi:hypothetical protein